MGGFIAFGSAATVGALSDRYGRRPFLFASVISNLLPPAVLAVPGVVESYFWLYDVLGALGSFTGGIVFLSFAYTADKVSHEEKAKAFTVVGAMIPVSFLFGTSCGVGLQKAFGSAGPSYIAVVPCHAFFAHQLFPS